MGSDTLIVGESASLAAGATITGVTVTSIENLAVRAGAENASLTAGPTGSVLTAGGGTSTLTGGAGSDTYVITKDIGTVTINGFGTITGSTDIIHVKGFPANSKVTRGVTSSQLLVNGNLAVTVGDEAAAAITSALGTFVRFVD